MLSAPSHEEEGGGGQGDHGYDQGVLPGGQVGLELCSEAVWQGENKARTSVVW